MRRVEFAGCLVRGHVLSELLELKPLERLRWAGGRVRVRVRVRVRAGVGVGV